MRDLSVGQLAASIYGTVLTLALITAFGAEVVGQLREAFPLVQASFPPVLGLVLGGVGLLDDDSAVYLALGIGVAELAGWGIATGRKERLGALRTGGLIGLNVGLGLTMVGLKLLIH